MRVTADILQQEFIGLSAKVVRSPNSSLLGISGRVINETRNTLVIQHKNRARTVAKNVAVLHFVMPDGTIVEITGKVIVGRPEDRVKRHVRRRW